MIRHIGDDLFALNKALFRRDEFMFIYQTPDRCPRKMRRFRRREAATDIRANMLPQRCVKKLAFGCGRCEICAKSGFGRDKFLRRHRYFRAHLSAHQIFSKTIMRTILAKIAALRYLSFIFQILAFCCARHIS